MRVLATTAASAYRLDVDQLAREVLDQQERLLKQGLPHACAVRLHRQTQREAMRHKPEQGVLPYWAPAATVDDRDTFVGLPVVTDDGVPLGYATLEACAGCLSIRARCEYVSQ